MGKVKLKSGDLLICAAVFVCALLLFLLPLLGEEQAETVAVFSGDELLFTLPLEKDTVKTVESRGYTLTLTVQDGSCRVKESDCPDGICRKSGAIHSAGEVIVCVPARITIKITGRESGYDAVAH